MICFRKTTLSFYDIDNVREDITIEHNLRTKTTIAYDGANRRIGIVSRKKLTEPGAFPVHIRHGKKGWKLTVGWDKIKMQFTVDVQGKRASELHYKGPMEKQKEGYIPSINCIYTTSHIELNDITIVDASTEINWSSEDMCYRTEAMLGFI